MALGGIAAFAGPEQGANVRKIVVSELLSLDGVMVAPVGEIRS
jgi:hypothetical protein